MEEEGQCARFSYRSSDTNGLACSEPLSSIGQPVGSKEDAAFVHCRWRFTERSEHLPDLHRALEHEALHEITLRWDEVGMRGVR